MLFSYQLSDFSCQLFQEVFIAAKRRKKSDTGKSMLFDLKMRCSEIYQQSMLDLGGP